MEIPHCELEKYHYAALKHPEYQLEGMLDVMREEMMMSMPCYPVPVEMTPVISHPRPMNNEFAQLKNEVIGWRQKHAEALLEIDKLKAKVHTKTKYNKYI